MKTITSVQFLSQSEKVQKVLKNHIQFEEGDHFYNTKQRVHYTYEDFYKCMYSLARPTWEGEYFSNLDDFVPLLTETQLREFIERFSGRIQSIGITGHDYSITTFLGSFGIDFAKDLFDAYWQVATQIANEEED